MKSSAINYGLYCGVILAAFTILAYAFNLSLFSNIWFGLTLLLVTVIIGLVSSAKAKSLNNGFLTFKEAFSSYFITIAIGILISTIISFILFAYIDPDAAETIKQETIEVTITSMERFGAPDEEIEKRIKTIEEADGYSISAAFQGYIKQIIFFSVIGLIVALIMKKNNPEQY